MNKLKLIPLFVIIAGIIITCYGSWKIIDSHMKTNHSLEEAKKATEPVLEKNETKSAVLTQRKKNFTPKRVRQAAF